VQDDRKPRARVQVVRIGKGGRSWFAGILVLMGSSSVSSSIETLVSLTRTRAERARKGVVKGSRILTEYGRPLKFEAKVSNCEHDGRRFGSYAMYPLRGPRAAVLVFEVKATPACPAFASLSFVYVWNVGAVPRGRHEVSDVGLVFDSRLVQLLTKERAGSVLSKSCKLQSCRIHSKASNAESTEADDGE
jgi:hypothetical protein